MEPTIKKIKKNYRKFLTQNKDADLLIMSKLDDEDLFNLCLTDKYASKLCKSEDFWKNRFIHRFGVKYGPTDGKTWKNQYLKLVRYLDLFPEIDVYSLSNGLYLYFEDGIKRNMFNRMKNYLQDVLESTFNLKTYTEEEIEKILKDEEKNIWKAVEIMFKAYKTDGDLIILQKGGSIDLYRDFLFDYVDYEKYYEPMTI